MESDYTNSDKKCYGKSYSSKNIKCKSCQIVDYCRDAIADEDERNNNRDMIEYNDNINDDSDVERQEFNEDQHTMNCFINTLQALGTDKFAILGKMITYLLGVKKRNTWHYNVIIDKLLNPEQSYAVLGSKYKKSYKAVHHVIDRAVKQFPLIKRAIYTDVSRIEWMEEKEKAIIENGRHCVFCDQTKSDDDFYSYGGNYNKCKKCYIDAQKDWYQKNKAKALVNAEHYRKQNKDYYREYRTVNKDKIREQRQRLYQKKKLGL